MSSTNSTGSDSTSIFTEATDVEIVLIIIWSVLTVVISVPGNLLILVGSLKYSAIKLDRITKTLLEQVAVADLGYALTRILPAGTSAMAGGWVLGGTACAVQTRAGFLCCGASVFLVAALNISKLTCLLFPLKSLKRACRTGYYISGGIWCGVFVALTVLNAQEIDAFVETGRPRDTKYIPEQLMCFYVMTTTERTDFDVGIAVCAILPMVVILGTTIRMIGFVRSVRSQTNSLMPLILVSVVNMASFLPIFIILSLTKIMDTVTKSEQWEASPVFSACYRTALSMTTLNFLVNPLIYFATVKSFNLFVKRTLSCCWKGRMVAPVQPGVNPPQGGGVIRIRWSGN